MAKDNTNKGEKTYIDFVDEILSSLSNNELYQTFNEFIKSGENKITIHHQYTSKKIDVDWVAFLEDCIISMDNVIRNPKKFIAQEEEVIPTSLARSITTESIKHLSQHTNLINVIDGEIKPEKILNIRKEESYQVYENRFAWTLLARVTRFIDKRFEALNKTIEKAEEIRIEEEANAEEKGKAFNYKLEVSHIGDLTPNDIENLDRIEKIRLVISGFYSSAFAKQMKGSEPVRPPIVRTNSILKNPDYQKLLKLWQFVESYDKEGYGEESAEEDLQGNERLENDLTSTMFLNYLLVKTLVKNEKKQEVEEEEETEEKKIENERIRIIEKIIERNRKEAASRDPNQETSVPPSKDDGDKSDPNARPEEGEGGELYETPRSYKITSSATGEPYKVGEDEEADEVRTQKIEVLGKAEEQLFPKQSLNKSRIIRDFIERAIAQGDLDDVDIVSIQRKLQIKQQHINRERIAKVNQAIDRTLDDYDKEVIAAEIERREKLNQKREEEMAHLNRLSAMLVDNQNEAIKDAKLQRRLIEKALKRETELNSKIDSMLKEQEKLKEKIVKILEEIGEEQAEIDKLKEKQ